MAYPPPLVIPPRQLPHKQTFIILHGRGSSADKFGPVLLDSTFELSRTAAAEHATLATAFPHARFIFPTAARRRAALYRRAYTHQWFDNWELDPPATEREELQAPGLRETVAYLHDLIRTEVAGVPGGAASVVLGGLSQGCAAVLVALMLWEGEPLAAAFGMCGWLPYAVRLREQMLPEATGSLGTKDDAFDPFDRGESDDDDSESDPSMRAVDWLREEIQLQRSQALPEIVLKNIPIFLGHGVDDEKVNVVLGRTASECLRDFGVCVDWKEYMSLGHWYSADMLRDICVWIQSTTMWKV